MPSRPIEVHPDDPTRRGRAADLAWWLLVLTATLLLVALFVGWILVWAASDRGPREVMLSLGSVAFTLVLVVLGLLLGRLRSERRLREAEARFLTGASHNLRTPLAGILAAASTLAREGVAEEDKRALVATVRREARLLALRVDNLIETGRIDIERASGGKEPADLARIVRESVLAVQDRIEGRGGVVHCEICPRSQILADERMVRLVVENLLDNAVRFSTEAPRIDVELADREGRSVLSVRDQGAGFDPATRQNPGRGIVRPGPRGGLGLGLALCARIARDHGGRLFLESDGPGKGAIARLELPSLGEA
ncbi:MAG: HAMP domain-containing histidine kinase [Planctomycetes bacterium]|nr:HAMP domain-containing histidine kinase [Planctomycetota bacterium]